MVELERLTISMPAEMASTIKAAVANGDYASSSEVIREAVREWRIRRTVQQGELAALKADIDKAFAEELRVFDIPRSPMARRARVPFAGVDRR